MSAQPAHFVWYELLTNDVPSASAFYRDVIGWDVTEAGVDRPYCILNAGETAVGGLLALPQDALAMGARPSWMGYIGVADVDTDVQRTQELGGGLYRPAEDIKGVGRFAVVHDPQGAPFVLFTPATAERSPATVGPGMSGHLGWRELHAADLEPAFAFYAAMFGWTKGEVIDVGPMGPYQLFATGGQVIGGMVTKPRVSLTAFWLFYINVSDIDSAISRVTAAGGRLLNGPQQVPGGSWVAQCLDEQGAAFAMVSASK